VGGLSLAFLLAAGLRGDVATVKGSKYGIILERNPFGLRPLPTNTVVTPTPTNPPPVQVDVQLSGITADPLGTKAWLVIPPPKTSKDKEVKYVSMREGESDGDVEVVKIDPDRRTVTIVNAGSTVTLDFENNAPATVAARPAAKPGRAVPGRRPGTATARPSARVLGQPTTTSRSRGVRPNSVARPPRSSMRSSSLSRPNTSAPRIVGGGGRPSASLQTIPPRNIRTASPPQANVDPATQWLQMKAAEETARRQGIVYPPTPPIPGMPLDPGQ